MKMTFRWYGEKDNIPLSYIRQIPNMSGVVSAVYDVPVGQVWEKDQIERLISCANQEGLQLEVIESVPVHEDIKLGTGKRDEYIANYCQTIRNLGEYGVKCICYNFMPVFDWLRTNMAEKNEDGSTSLSYHHEEVLKLDKKHLSLPGWDESYTPEELTRLLEQYEKVSHEDLFNNLVYFLNGILPACEEADICMGVHPDDPPWDIFGLPRIIQSEENLDRLFAAVPSKCNGLTFCTGSLGAGRNNDLVRMAKKYAAQGRIPFAHLRNVRYEGDLDFAESGHLSAAGSLDLYAIVKALQEGGFNGYVRPDHGRSIWGESGKGGYGLYDRALGASYLNGLFEAVEKESQR